jgi:hypothetical protein
MFNYLSSVFLHLLLWADVEVNKATPAGNRDIWWGHKKAHYLLDEAVSKEAEEEHLAQWVDQITYYWAGIHIHGVDLWRGHSVTYTQMCNNNIKECLMETTSLPLSNSLKIT